MVPALFCAFAVARVVNASGCVFVVVRVLLDNGADPWIKWMGKWTAVDIARCFNRSQVAGMLEAAMARTRPRSESQSESRFVRFPASKFFQISLVKNFTTRQLRLRFRPAVRFRGWGSGVSDGASVGNGWVALAMVASGARIGV